MRTPSETLKPATQRIARQLLAHPLASYIGYESDENSLYRVQQAIEHGMSPGFCSMFNIEFRRAGTNCSLSIKAEAVDHYSGERYEKDAEGNEYRRHQITTDVNWPCHGAVDPATALARLELMREVAILAASIQAEFANGMTIWSLAYTKEQRAEENAKKEAEKAKQEAQKVQDAAARVIEAHNHNMRVSSSVIVVKTADIDPIIVDGEYTHSAKGKTFTLTVTSEGNGVRRGLVQRTA